MGVTILGGAAWNRMIHVERLPDGRSATVHPTGYHDAIGGAGAGKAMNLARLGVDVTLFVGLGDDEPGSLVRDGLEAAGVDVRVAADPTGTAQHVNLMDPVGGRISLMLGNGSPDLAFDIGAISASMAGADVVVVDLAPWTPRVLDLARASGRPMWTDIHDHDATSSWHEPFIEAADVVFASHDRLPDVPAFLESVIGRGKRLVVCTMGAAGALAMDAERCVHEVQAVAGVEVVDTNGAGDAFFAGVLFGILDGAQLDVALRYGAEVAALAVGSRELASPESRADRLRSLSDRRPAI